jgi:hypothetical protein
MRAEPVPAIPRTFLSPGLNVVGRAFEEKSWQAPNSRAAATRRISHDYAA